MKNIDEKKLPEPFTQKGFYGWEKKSYHFLDGKIYGVCTMKRYDKSISCIATVGNLAGIGVFTAEYGAEKIYGTKYLKKATEKNIVKIHNEFVKETFNQP